MNTARITFNRDGDVTLNGEKVGSLQANYVGKWSVYSYTFVPKNPAGLLGLEFSRRTQAELRREMYRRLTAPLSGR